MIAPMILRTLLYAARQYNLVPAKTTLVVAVSGGMDSLVLLHVLHALQSELDCTLHVATFNHGLRADSTQDVRHVQQFADARGLPVSAGHSDSQAPSANQEAWAREQRYRFLAQVAREQGATHIATAHHADDQAETVLLHLLRGSGTQGLTGMSHKSALPYAAPTDHLTLIRPLLHVARQDIDAYATEHAIQARHDPSNDDRRYARNKIRHELLPTLAGYNPQIVNGLTRLADVLRTEDDYMQAAFQREVWTHAAYARHVVRLPLEHFRGLHPAMQRRFILQAVALLRDDGPLNLTYEHVEQALALALHGVVGAQVQFPGDLRLRIDYDYVVIDYNQPPAYNLTIMLTPDNELTLQIPGSHVIGKGVLIASLQPRDDAIAALALPTGARVTLRTRRPGDRWRPLGLQGHSQKLKKWLIDHRIPQGLRDQLPLLCVNDEIAAIVMPGAWAIAEPFKVATPEAGRQIVYWCVKMQV